MYFIQIRYPRPEPPEQGWLFAVVEQVSGYPPVGDQQRSGFLVDKREELDVRTLRPEGIFPQPEVVASSWVASDAELRAYRVWEGEALDVLSIPLLEAVYAQPQIIPGDWAAIVAEQSAYLVDEAPALDVRIIPPPLLPVTVATLVRRTTQIIAEVVIKPHQQTGTIEQPPPILFDTHNILVRLTGPAQAMEVCSGYVGAPPVLTQLQEVRAHYTTYLAPLTSALHPVHTPQIGRTEKTGVPGVLSPKNSWFHMRQTDRYHRVCLNCTGDTEITGLTWMLREAGIR